MAKLGVVALAFDPNTQEAVAEVSLNWRTVCWT